MNQSAPILGIDLGTSTCLVCAEMLDQSIRVFRPEPDLEHAQLLPSVFCYQPEQAGEPAKTVFGHHAKGLQKEFKVVENFKRLMRHSDRKVMLGRHKGPKREFTPQQISGMVLGHLRRIAEDQLGLQTGSIREAIVTVPAYFGNTERKNTREAGENFGGFDKIHLLDEPVSAAIGLDLHLNDREQLVMVVDLGGGTLDVTLLRAGRGVGESGIDELGRHGRTIGGLEWDEEIAKICVYGNDWPVELLDRDKNREFYDDCELAKRGINDDRGKHQPIGFYSENLNETYECKVRPEDYIERSYELADFVGRICNALLLEIQDADLERLPLNKRRWFRPRARSPRRINWSDIDGVYLVGGGSLNLEVRETIQQLWGKKLPDVPRPQHQVGYGAAKAAAMVSRNPHVFDSMGLRSAFTTGILYKDHAKQLRFFRMLGRNTQLPTEKEREFEVGLAERSRLVVDVLEEHVHPGWRGRDDEPLADVNTSSQDHPVLTADGPGTWSDESNGHVYHLVKRVEIPELAPPQHGNGNENETVFLHLSYPSDRDILFRTSFRGRGIEMNLR